MPQLCTTPNCPCSTNPFANLSSEDPDRQVFIGLHWSFVQPPLGGSWTKVICGASCQSSVSQYEADLCAQRAAERCCLCDHQSEVPCIEPCGGDCADSIQPPCVDPPIPPCPPPFCNVPQGCQNSQFSAQVSGGEFYAHTQADADAIAASVCQSRLLTGPRTENTPGCPVVTGMSPESPAHANEGESLVIVATVSYTGPGPLSFLWYLNGIPLANTPTASLTLDSLGTGDSGTYVLQVSAPGCPVTLSPPVILEVVSSCIEDVGPLPPDGATPFEITADVEWETFSVVSGDYTPVVSSLGFCNPTNLQQAIWAGQPARSPGNYQLEYLSGYFQEIIPSCGDPICAQMAVYQLWDDEHNYDTPVACDGLQCLANIWPFCACQGASAQGADNISVQALFNPFLGQRYDFNLVGDRFHTVTGGDFRIVWDEGGLGPISSFTAALGYEMTFKVWQVTGLLAEPEKLAIPNWATVSASLPDSVALNWNGELNTRTTYSQILVQWNAPASGDFDGAVCYYTQAHPTSPNGCGWVLEIYSAGAVLEWKGYKITNNKGAGNYLKAAEIDSDLGCIELIDNT